MPPAPPSAPVLEGDGLVVFDYRWTLKGSAPPDTVVRVHLDERCSGPALLDVTSDELAQGVPVQLVSGVPSVFTAVSIDALGVRSECSSVVRVSFQRPPRPRLIDVNLTPQPPTRETQFVISGSAENAVLVRLFEGTSCTGTHLAELSADAFRDVGFAVDVEPNGSRSFVVQALNAIRETVCASSVILAWNDRTPPVVGLSIVSPMPSPELSAFVFLSTDAAFGSIYLGPDCTGPILGSCSGSGCSGFRVSFPMAPSTSLSASAVDALGNASSCVNALSGWEWDPLAPTPLVTLYPAATARMLYARVPASCEWVEVFDGPVCDSSHSQAIFLGARLAGTGQFFSLPRDGGVLVARGLSADMMTAYPCSQPVPWE